MCLPRHNIIGAKSTQPLICFRFGALQSFHEFFPPLHVRGTMSVSQLVGKVINLDVRSSEHGAVTTVKWKMAGNCALRGVPFLQEIGMSSDISPHA